MVFIEEESKELKETTSAVNTEPVPETLKATTVAEQLLGIINLRFTVSLSFLKSLISEALYYFSPCVVFFR